MQINSQQNNKGKKNEMVLHSSALYFWFCLLCEVLAGDGAD